MAIWSKLKESTFSVFYWINDTGFFPLSVFLKGKFCFWSSPMVLLPIKEFQRGYRNGLVVKSTVCLPQTWGLILSIHMYA